MNGWIDGWIQHADRPNIPPQQIELQHKNKNRKKNRNDVANEIKNIVAHKHWTETAIYSNRRRLYQPKMPIAGQHSIWNYPSNLLSVRVEIL